MQALRGLQIALHGLYQRHAITASSDPNDHWVLGTEVWGWPLNSFGDLLQQNTFGQEVQCYCVEVVDLRTTINLPTVRIIFWPSFLYDLPKPSHFQKKKTKTKPFHTFLPQQTESRRDSNLGTYSYVCCKTFVLKDPVKVGEILLWPFKMGGGKKFPKKERNKE